MVEYFEKQIIASCIDSPKRFVEAAMHIKSGDFKNADYRLIWDCMSECHEKHDSISISTVMSELVKASKPDHLQGLFLDITKTSGSLNVKPIYSAISNASDRRKLTEFLGATISDVSNENISVHELTTKTIDNLENLLIKSKHVVHECANMKDYEPSNVEYIKTGFKTIDETIEGFERGNLAIFGARTGLGKSRFSMQIAESVAKTLPVLFFSLEMPARQLKYNLLSQVTGIFSDRIKKGTLSEKDREKLDKAIEYCRTLKLEFVDSVNSIDEIVNIISSRCMVKDYGLIVIDYIQLISGSSKKDNRHLEISEISKKLKRLAIKKNVPIFCPAQLGRQVELKKTKEPSKEDLKESGSLEEDADLIFFIWKKNDDPMNKDVIFKCEKNRNNGRFCRVELPFDNSKISFVEKIDVSNTYELYGGQYDK